MGKTQYLGDVPEENKFYLQNGNVLKNVEDLLVELQCMDEGTFNHHVNPQKNDFYNWIAGSIKDVQLADKIKGVNTKEELHCCVHERVHHLKKKCKKKACNKKTCKNKVGKKNAGKSTAGKKYAVKKPAK